MSSPSSISIAAALGSSTSGKSTRVSGKMLKYLNGMASNLDQKIWRESGALKIKKKRKPKAIDFPTFCDTSLFFFSSCLARLGRECREAVLSATGSESGGKEKSLFLREDKKLRKGLKKRKRKIVAKNVATVAMRQKIRSRAP